MKTIWILVWSVTNYFNSGGISSQYDKAKIFENQVDLVNYLKENTVSKFRVFQAHEAKILFEVKIST